MGSWNQLVKLQMSNFNQAFTYKMKSKQFQNLFTCILWHNPIKNHIQCDENFLDFTVILRIKLLLTSHDLTLFTTKMFLFVSSLCVEWSFYGQGEEPKKKILLRIQRSRITVYSLCQKKTDRQSLVNMKPQLAEWIKMKVQLLEAYLYFSSPSKKTIIHTKLCNGVNSMEWLNEWMVIQSSNKYACCFQGTVVSVIKGNPLWNALLCVQLSINNLFVWPLHLGTSALVCLYILLKETLPWESQG